MTTATIKATSIHDYISNWRDHGDCWVGSRVIGYGYFVYFWAGANYASLPNYKLHSPCGYGELEMVVFDRDGREVDLVPFLCQILLPEEIEQLGLTPGVKQKYLHHRMALKVLKRVRFLLSIGA